MMTHYVFLGGTLARARIMSCPLAPKVNKEGGQQPYLIFCNHNFSPKTHFPSSVIVVTLVLSILPTHTHTDSSRVTRVEHYTVHWHFERLWALSDSFEHGVEQFGPTFSPRTQGKYSSFTRVLFFVSSPPPITHSPLPCAIDPWWLLGSTT
jgi:hypothetical protein